MARKHSSEMIEYMAALRTEIERVANRRMLTPIDFDFLAECIRDSVHQNVSSTTLKRVWGYVHDVDDNYIPGKYTLTVLAHFVGCLDMDDYIRKLTHTDICNNNPGTDTVESNRYFGKTIWSNDMPIGAVVELRWSPNRFVAIRHLSGNRFVVEQSENAKLRVGDEIECYTFTQNAPLYVGRIFSNNMPQSSYLAGSRTGVRYVIKPQKP